MWIVHNLNFLFLSCHSYSNFNFRKNYLIFSRFLDGLLDQERLCLWGQIIWMRNKTWFLDPAILFAFELLSLTGTVKDTMRSVHCEGSTESGVQSPAFDSSSAKKPWLPRCTRPLATHLSFTGIKWSISSEHQLCVPLDGATELSLPVWKVEEREHYFRCRRSPVCFSFVTEASLWFG